MKFFKITLLFLFTVFLSSNFVISNAYAYIDPGSGSLILQMLIGVLVGIGIAVKVYWFKLKEKFSRRK
jgi:hypothetical protein|tara:strand:+ start:207 stop:410 length:204 start_codon:yes stop_codon:yes gene_type:complete